MRQNAPLLILTSLLMTACGVQARDIEATVQAAIAGTQTAQTALAAATPALPTPTPHAVLTSGTPTIASTRVPTAEPSSAATISAPSPMSQTPAPARSSPLEEMASGMMLFVKESKVVSGTGEIESYELYSIVGGKVSLAASDLDSSSTYAPLSPGGTMVASGFYGSDGKVQVIAPDTHGGAAKITSYVIPGEYKADTQRSSPYPYWSPDSTKLAVKTDCSLYVLTLTTGEFVEIWHECYPAVILYKGIVDVAWSPDGTQLAFTVVVPSRFPSSNLQDDLHGDYPAKLLAADADGKAHVVLDEDGSHPVWSPDGQQVVYTGGWRRDNDGDVYCNEQLYVINADGTGRVELAETTGQPDDSWTRPYYGEVLWSSDREHVIFTQGRPHQPGQLSVIRPDGMGRVILGGKQSFGVQNWPRGNRIAWYERLDPTSSAAFVSNLDGVDKIEWDRGAGLEGLGFCGDKVLWRNSSTWFIANLDGSARRSLPGKYDALWPEWFFSPDCSQVVFTSGGGDDQITIVDATSMKEFPLLVAKSGESFYVEGWIPTSMDTQPNQ